MWQYIVTWTLVSWFLTTSMIKDEYGRGKYKTVDWQKKEVIHSKKFLDKTKAIKFIENAPENEEDNLFNINDMYCEDMKLDSVFIGKKK